MQGRIANTLIAWARHGEGCHIDRETGLSQIDLDKDWNRRRAERLHAAAERRCEGGPA